MGTADTVDRIDHGQITVHEHGQDRGPYEVVFTTTGDRETTAVTRANVLVGGIPADIVTNRATPLEATVTRQSGESTTARLSVEESGEPTGDDETTHATLAFVVESAAELYDASEFGSGEMERVRQQVTAPDEWKLTVRTQRFYVTSPDGVRVDITEIAPDEWRIVCSSPRGSKGAVAFDTKEAAVGRMQAVINALGRGEDPIDAGLVDDHGAAVGRPPVQSE